MIRLVLWVGLLSRTLVPASFDLTNFDSNYALQTYRLQIDRILVSRQQYSWMQAGPIVPPAGKSLKKAGPIVPPA
ncbi:hypothetical protein [Leptolyngbya sp. 'hensonii']|uniref:hypothetical protein n=1 Tax=Leptolyngbya sp. 'hensonii' TaxID=1922337 RepID=UPI0009501E5B|nr:hypothetical protein [Leptolyngbya sp. 'hensonii']